MSVNSSPMKPSLTHVVIRTRPPGRQTRMSSAAAAAWSGANMAPKVETTRSKLASANGSAWASPSIHATSTPAAAACPRASSSSSGVTSSPTTFAPRSAAGIATLPPLPVPTSSSSTPGSMPARSITSSPACAINRAQLSQVTRCPRRAGPATELVGSGHRATLAEHSSDTQPLV